MENTYNNNKDPWEKTGKIIQGTFGALDYPQKAMMRFLTNDHHEKPSEWLESKGVNNAALNFAADFVVDPLTPFAVSKLKYLKQGKGLLDLRKGIARGTPVADKFNGLRKGYNSAVYAAKSADLVGDTGDVINRLDQESEKDPVAYMRRKFQPGGEQTGEPFWSPGMMYQPTNPIEAMLTGAEQWMEAGSFKPEPIDISGFDAQYTANQSSVDLNRDYNVAKNQVGINENPSQYIGDSELAGDMNKNSLDESKRKFNGNLFANRTLGILGGINGFLERKSDQDGYNRLLRSLGNTDNKYKATTLNGSRGDYTLNTGLGNNFRPDKSTYGSYKEGGEYKMSQEEIDAFIAAGGELDIL